MVFVAVSMGMILAVALLVVDGGRAFALHTQTQNAADQVALAAARDLDTTTGMCTSACLATLQKYAHANGIPSSTQIVQCDATHATDCYTAPYNGQVGEIQVRLENSAETFFGRAVAGLLGGAIPFINVGASAAAGRHVVIQPATLSGNYIYADQDVILHTGAQLEEPVVAGRDIDLSGGNGDFIWPDARLVSAGRNIITKPGKGTIGAGIGNVGEPLTTLSRDVPANLTTLTSAVTATQSTVPVASGASIQNGDFILVDSEQMKVTAGGGTTSLTVTRAQSGTAGAAHPKAATVYDLTVAATTLGAAIITTNGTTVQVSSGTGIQNGDTIRVDSEQMQVTAGGGTTTLTVTRGQNGTTRATHANGATVYDPTISLTLGVASTANFPAVAGAIVKIDPAADGSCEASPCEYAKYSGFGAFAPSFTVSLTCGSGAALCRGYGGFGAPPATSHLSAAAVDGRVGQLWAGGGCGTTPSGPFLFTNCQQTGALASQQNIYAGPTIKNCAYPQDPSQGCLSPPFAPPSADADFAYQNAAVGGAGRATTTCTGAAAPSFDNDSALNHSLPGSFQVLTPTTGYTCTGTAPDGSRGELAWVPGSAGGPGTLTAHGLIFIDSDFKITSPLTYHTEADPNYNNSNSGATIWASGTMQNLSNTTAVCAVAGTAGHCDTSGGAWNPTTNALGIVAAGSCAACGAHAISINADFQGDVYTTGDFSNNSGMVEQGLIIAQTVNIFSGTGNPVPEVTSLPGGFPGSQEVINTSLVE